MKEFSTEIWSAQIPDDWEGEEDEEGVVLYRPEGAGELQITVTEKEEGLVDDEDLEYFAAELIEAGHQQKIVRVGELQGLLFEYREEDTWWREWYLAYDELFFYVTYDCDFDARHEEIQFVQDILKSISVH
ncbi:MAG TPA: hypothetical protein VKZ99_01500 [Gammaproteobacteria bacterium]|nr:hypothetical protein [Gammaproteobacteria bacterium]